MNPICIGLLFLHGHIHDPRLARRLDRPPTRPAGKPIRPSGFAARLAALYLRLCHGIGDGQVRAQ